MEETLVYKVILSHLRYKENVEAYLGGGPYPSLTAHTDCMLGKWYYGEEGKRFAHHPDFPALGEAHRLFHEAAQAVAAKERGDEAAAKRHMDEAYVCRLESMPFSWPLPRRTARERG